MKSIMAAILVAILDFTHPGYFYNTFDVIIEFLDPENIGLDTKIISLPYLLRKL